MIPCEPCTPPSHAVVHSLPPTAIVYRERTDANVAHGVTYRFKVPRSCAPGTFIRVPVPGASPATIETVTVRVPDDFVLGARLSFVLPCDFAEQRARARAAIRLQAVARGHATRHSEDGCRAQAVREIAARAHWALQKHVQGASRSSSSSSGATDGREVDALSAQLLWVEREELELLAV